MSEKKTPFADYIVVPSRKSHYHEGADSDAFGESGGFENNLAQRYKFTPTLSSEMYSLGPQKLSALFLNKNLLQNITILTHASRRTAESQQKTTDVAWKRFIDSQITPVLNKAGKSLQSIEAQFESFLNLPVLSPPTVEELLSSLYTSTDPEVVSQLILELELAKIPRRAEADFCAFLYRYILENRDQDKHSVQVSVGSAIRKLVVLWQPDMAKAMPLSALLETGHLAQLPVKLQLELLRTILLAYEDGVVIHETDQNLLSRAEYIAKACVNDIIVNERPYGAAALNALLLLIFMGKTDLVGNLVEQLRSTWFVELFHDRLAEILELYPDRLPSAEISALIARIDTYARRAH